MRGCSKIGTAVLAMLLVACATGHAAVALLMEDPYGQFGAFNPTGHAAVYLNHVCAETPTELRMCREGELGVVISRYHKINGYDWVAITADSVSVWRGIFERDSDMGGQGRCRDDSRQLSQGAPGDAGSGQDGREYAGRRVDGADRRIVRSRDPRLPGGDDTASRTSALWRW